MTNDGRSHCPHGFVVDRVVSANCWSVPYAGSCDLCAGEPAGIPYKDMDAEPGHHEDHEKISPGAIFQLKPSPPWFGVYTPTDELLAIFPSRRSAAIYARGPHCASLEHDPYVYVVYGEASKVQPDGNGHHGFSAR